MFSVYSRLLWPIAPREPSSSTRHWPAPDTSWSTSRLLSISMLIFIVPFRSLAWRPPFSKAYRGVDLQITIDRHACQKMEIKHSRTRPYTPRTNGKAERGLRRGRELRSASPAAPNCRYRFTHLAAVFALTQNRAAADPSLMPSQSPCGPDALD